MEAQKTHTCANAWKKGRLIAAMVLSTSFVSACGGSTSDTSDVSSYPKLSSKWTSTTIPVCWEASADGFVAERAWVRELVEAEYETKTRLDFTGWGKCTATSRGIRIAVSDRPGDNPHTKGLGRALDGVKNGMELNFTFNNWSSSCKNRRKSCIQSIGVHEFGHAIGLAHEHNRPDTPDTCKQSRQGSQGDRLVGRWDASSVMNYCNPVYNNGGRLSAGDVAGIAELYGRR